MDAMARFGSLLARRDLSSVYQKAGSTFAGALSQYFVVLSDERSGLDSQMDPNLTPIGLRRGVWPARRSCGGRFPRGRSALDRGQKRGLDVSVEVEDIANGPSRKQEKQSHTETMDVDASNVVE